MDLVTLVQVDILQTLQCQRLLILHRAPAPPALPRPPPLVGPLLHFLLNKDEGFITAFRALFLGLSPLL